MKEIEVYVPVRNVVCVPVKRSEYKRLKGVESDLHKLKVSAMVVAYTILVGITGFAIGTGILCMVR